MPFKRKLFFDVIALITLSTLIFVMGLYLLLRSGIITDRFNSMIAAEMSKVLGVDVSIGKVTGGIFSGLVLNDVVVAESVGGFSIDAQRVQLHLDLWNLLLRKGSLGDNLNQIKLIGPRVTVVGQGDEIYLGLLAPFKLSDNTSATLPKIPRLILRKGELILRDEGGRSLAFSDLNGTLKLDERLEVRLKGETGNGASPEGGSSRGEEGSFTLDGWSDLTPASGFAFDLNITGVQVSDYQDFIPSKLPFKLSEGLLSLRLEMAGDSGEGDRVKYTGFLELAQGLLSLENLEDPVKLEKMELRIEDGLYTSFSGHIDLDVSYGGDSAKLSGDLKVKDARLDSFTGSSEIEALPFIGGKASVDGVFSSSDGLNIKGEADAIDLARLAEGLGFSHKISGLAAARFSLDGSLDKIHLRVEAESPRLELTDEAVANALELRLNAEGLDLGQLVKGEGGARLALVASLGLEVSGDDLKIADVHAFEPKAYLSAQGAELRQVLNGDGKSLWSFRLTSSAEGRLEASTLRSGVWSQEEIGDLTSRFVFKEGMLNFEDISFKLLGDQVESKGVVTVPPDPSSFYGYDLGRASFDLRASAQKIDLGAAAEPYGYPIQGQGRLNVHLYGDTSDPTLEAKIEANDIKVSGQDFPSLSGDIVYQDGRSFASVEALNGSLKGELNYRKAQDGQESLSAELGMNDFEADFLIGLVDLGQNYDIQESFKGLVVEGSIKVEGDLASLDLYGDLSMQQNGDRLGDLRMDGFLIPSVSAPEALGVNFTLGNVFLEMIPPLREKYPDLRGRATIEGTASGSLKRPRLTGDFGVYGVHLNREMGLGDIEGGFVFEEYVLKIDSLNAFNNRVVGDLVLPLKEGSIDADIKIHSFELSEAFALVVLDYPSQLENPFLIDGEVKITGRLENPSIRASLNGLYDSNNASNLPPIKVGAIFTGYGDDLLLDSFTLSQGEGRISGGGQIEIDGGTFTAKGIKIEKINLKEFLGAVGLDLIPVGADEALIIDGVVDVWGDSSQVRILGGIDASYPIDLGSDRIYLPARLEGGLTYQGGIVAVSALRLKTGNSLLEGFGQLGPGGDMDFSLRVVEVYATDLFVGAPVSSLVDRLSPVSGELRIKGSLETPVVEGDLAGGYWSKGVQASTSLPDYKARVIFNLQGRTVSVEGFEIKGDGGTIDGNGRITFDVGGVGALASLEINELGLGGIKFLQERYPDINGHLNLKGDLTRSQQGWRLDGEVSGVDVSLAKGVDVDLNGKFSLDPKSLHISPLSFGRTMRGEVQIDLTDTEAVDALVRVFEADLREILSLSGSQMPYFNLSAPLPLNGEIKVSGDLARPVVSGRIEAGYDLPDVAYNLLVLSPQIPSTNLKGFLEFVYLDQSFEVAEWAIESERGSMSGRGRAQVREEGIGWELSATLADINLDDGLSLASGKILGRGDMSAGSFTSAHFELTDIAYRLNEIEGSANSKVDLFDQGEGIGFRISYDEPGTGQDEPLRKADLSGSLDRSGLRELDSTADFDVDGTAYRVVASMDGNRKLRAEVYQNYPLRTQGATLFLEPSASGLNGESWSGRAIIDGLQFFKGELNADADLKFEMGQDGRLAGQLLTRHIMVGAYEVGPLNAQVSAGDGGMRLDLKSYRGYSMGAVIDLATDPGWKVDLGLDQVRLSSIVELQEFVSPRPNDETTVDALKVLMDRLGPRPFLNGHLTISGKGNEVEALSGSLDLSLFEASLDTVLADFSLRNQILSLHRADVFLADGGKVSASGSADLNDEGDLALTLILENGSAAALVEAVGHYLPASDFSLDETLKLLDRSLGLGARADGGMYVRSSADVLDVKGNLDLSRLRPEIKADQLGLDFGLRNSPNRAEDGSRKIAASFKVEGLMADIAPILISFDGDLRGEKLTGRLGGTVATSGGNEIGSLTSEIEYHVEGAGRALHGRHASPYASPLLVIKSFSALDNRVRGRGSIGPDPEGDLNISLKGEIEQLRIDEFIGRIPQLSYLQDWLGGEVNGSFSAQGGASDIALNGGLSYSGGNVFGISVDHMETLYRFENGILTLRPREDDAPKRIWGQVDLNRPEADDAWSLGFTASDTQLSDVESLRRFYTYIRSVVPLEGTITGGLSNPSLKANFYSDSLNINGEISTPTSGWVSIKDGKLDYMVTDGGGSVVVEGRAHLDGIDLRSSEVFVPEVETHFTLAEADAALLFNAIPLRVSASELGGRVSGDIYMEGPANDQRGVGLLSFSQGRLGVLNAERVDASFSFDSRRLTFDSLRVMRWGGEIIGDGGYIDFITLGVARVSIDARLRNLPIAMLRANGEGRFDGLINANPGSPLIKGQLWFPTLNLNSRSFDGFRSGIEYHRDRKLSFLHPEERISSGSNGDGGYTVTGDLQFGGGILKFDHFELTHDGKVFIALDGRLNTQSRGDGIRIASPAIEAEDIIKLLAIPRRVEGLASLDLKLEGPLKSYDLSGRATLENGVIEGLSFSHLSTGISFDGKALTVIDGDMLYRGTDKIVLNGTIPVRGGGYQLRATLLEADLNILSSIFSEVVWTSGVYRGELKVEGTEKGPRLSGRLVVEDGRMKTRAIFDQARDIKGEVLIEDNVVSLGPLEGRMGDGTVVLTGQVGLRFGGEGGGGYRIGTTFYEISARSKGASGIPLRLSDWLSGRAFAEEVWIKGTTRVEPVSLGGRVRLDNALVVPPPGGWGALRGEVSAGGLLDRIVWDMEASAGENVWYQSFDDLPGIDLEARLEGTLKVTGPRSGLVVSGQMSTVEGSFNYLDRTFEIEEGSLRLLTGTGASSILRATGSTEVRYTSRRVRKSDTVYAHVDGTVRDAKIQLSSARGLPERAIVSVLTLGSDQGSLASFTEDISERLQDSLFLALEEQVHSVFITPVEETARSILRGSLNLNLDVLSFEPVLTRKRAEMSLTRPITLLDESRISAGMRISPDIFLDYEGILRNQASTLALSKNKLSLEYKLQLYLIDRLVISMSAERGSVTEGTIGIENKF